MVIFVVIFLHCKHKTLHRITSSSSDGFGFDMDVVPKSVTSVDSKVDNYHAGEAKLSFRKPNDPLPNIKELESDNTRLLREQQRPPIPPKRTKYVTEAVRHSQSGRLLNTHDYDDVPPPRMYTNGKQTRLFLNPNLVRASPSIDELENPVLDDILYNLEVLSKKAENYGKYIANLNGNTETYIDVYKNLLHLIDVVDDFDSFGYGVVEHKKLAIVRFLQSQLKVLVQKQKQAQAMENEEDDSHNYVKPSPMTLTRDSHETTYGKVTPNSEQYHSQNLQNHIKLDRILLRVIYCSDKVKQFQGNGHLLADIEQNLVEYLNDVTPIYTSNDNTLEVKKRKVKSLIETTLKELKRKYRST